MRKQAQKSKKRGSVVVVALIITAVSTLGLVGALGVVQARSAQVNSTEDAIFRRVRELNGRQLAREYVYQQVLPSTAGAGGTFEIPSNWGRITVGSWNESAFTTNTTGQINPVSPSPVADAYEVAVDVEVFSLVTDAGAWDTSSATQSYEYQVKGKNPSLAGTLLGIHRSGNGLIANNSVSGALTASGRSYIWESDSLSASREYDFDAVQVTAENSELGDDDYQVTAPGGNPAVSKLMPDNTPFQAWLNYGVAGSVTNAGLLNVVDGPNGNSLTQYVTDNGGVNIGGTSGYSGFGVSNDGAGHTTITLGQANLPNVILDAAHTQITLQGQTNFGLETAAANHDPVVIVVDGTLLTQLNIVNNNTRAIILGVQKGFGLGTVNLSISSAESVRMIMIAEECPMSVTCNGNDVEWEGGIITDRNFVHNNSGTLTIVDEDTPDELNNIAPRWLWVESYLEP